MATDSDARLYERADGKVARPRAREWRLREAYAAEQARRKAEAAEKRRQEENERLRQQAAEAAANPQPAPIENSAAPILRDRNNNIVPLSKRFNLGGSQYLGRSAYERADGKAAKVSARERKLRDAIVDLLRKAGIEVVTESEEGQRVLDMDSEHQAKLMGSKVERRKKEIAETLQGKELDQKQRAVVDVFTGESDNESFIVTDKAGKERNIKMRQGNELKAGTKHSIYRHYGTTSNGYNADELLFIPEVIEKGDRKQDSGKGVSYTLKKGEITYTVTTEISGKGEQFTNFFTDKKPTIAEQGTSNTDNQHVQPQMSAHNSSAKLQKVSEIDEESTKIIFETAKKLFGTTFDIREAGYILPDGSLLDFSGRHLLEGADDKFLRGRRTSDHREIASIEYERDGFTETGVKTDMSDFIRRGAIRIDVNAGAINLAVKPTKEQRDALQRLIERNDGDVQVDFGDGWDTDHYVEYANAKSNRILNDINRYFDENIKPTGNIKFFRTENGEAYGFTMGGRIYLDPRNATAETPIHEYTHLWAEALRQANPKVWEQLKSELEKDKDLMAYVQRLYPELKGDELMDEVFAHFSGRRGAERLRAEQERMEGETQSIVGKAKVIAMFENLRNALKKFWNAARDLFAGKSVKNESAEDFADMVLADLVGGVNPNNEIEAVKDEVFRQFTIAKNTNAKGRSIQIGNLTQEGRKLLETISGIKMKHDISFNLNISDLRNIYNEHYGDNEKDKGNNIPLTDEDIRSIVDVLYNPDDVIFGVEKKGEKRKLFFFLKDAGDGAYNLTEVYADRRGNLTAKSYYKTKKGSNLRAVSIKNDSELSTSETSGASLFSGAKIPTLFEISEKIEKKDEIKYQRADILNDYQERITAGQELKDEVNASGHRASFNADYTINLVHGTSPEAAEKIKAEGLQRNSYLAPSKSEANTHVSAKRKDNTFLYIKADARDISYNGATNEYYTEDGLVMDEDGVWVSPHRKAARQADSGVRFRGEEEPVFYSNAMRAVENIKQERATPEQWVTFDEGELDGDFSLGDFMEAGIDTHDLEWQLANPIAASARDKATLESINNLRSVVRGKKNTIKMYRAVPADLKEGSFRNGDWVTPSRKYAEQHIELQDWEGGRIIEQEVSVDDIWWNGDDINEWGFDDGKGYAYKNTENNRKLMEPTYDDNGNRTPEDGQDARAPKDGQGTFALEYGQGARAPDNGQDARAPLGSFNPAYLLYRYPFVSVFIII